MASLGCSSSTAGLASSVRTCTTPTPRALLLPVRPQFTPFQSACSSSSPAPVLRSNVRGYPSLVCAAAASAAPSTAHVGPTEAVVHAGAAAGEASNADLLLEQDAVEAGEEQEQEQVQQEPVMIEVEEVVTEVEEVIDQPLTFQLVAERSRNFLLNTNYGKVAAVGGVALLAITLGVAVKLAWEKTQTPRAKRLQQIDRNRTLVDGINAYLPGNRAGLTPGVLRKLRSQTRFTPVECFRKYLWYLLRERKFDQGAVDDLVALKVGLGLSDADVGDALRERGQRIYSKYGTLMLNTEGMTLSGAERKATCTALFRKLLYLCETPRLVGEPDSAGAQVADLRKIFGATEEDLERFRIKSLYEAEVDLEAAFAAEDDTHEDDGPGSSSSKKQQQQGDKPKGGDTPGSSPSA